MKKKTLVVILLALCCAATVGAVTACDGNKEDPNKQFEQTEFTVSFESNGGTAIADQGVLGNGKIADPGAPIKYGYDFVGWYKNEACTEKWNFDTDTVKEDTTLYALWEIKDATADTYFDFTAQEDGTTAISLKTGQNLPADVVLPSVHAEKAVTAIKDGAFEGQAAVKSFLIPDSVKRIGARAFRGCVALHEIALPEGLEMIGDDAFCGRRSVESLLLPSTLTSLDGFPFVETTNLTELQCAPLCQGYASRDGVLFSSSGLELVLYPSGKKEPEYEVPPSVATICANSFPTQRFLAKLVLSSGVTTIEENAIDRQIPLVVDADSYAEEWCIENKRKFERR